MIKCIHKKALLLRVIVPFLFDLYQPDHAMQFLR